MTVSKIDSEAAKRNQVTSSILELLRELATNDSAELAIAFDNQIFSLDDDDGVYLNGEKVGYLRIVND